MEKVRILFDTDIGDDIDDALALALALESPEIEIVGITTVFRNTAARTQLILEELAVYGRENIPVYTGIGTPLINVVDTTEIPKQAEVLTVTRPHKQDMDAVDFIIKTVSEQPDVIIMPIGAQTNIAVAFLKSPEIMKKAKIVAMAGVFTKVYPEWNILCDPEAARIVADRATDYTMVGLDVTCRCTLNEAQLTEIKNNTRPQVKFLYSMMQKWLNQSTVITLHDPLVVGYLIDNTILTLCNARVKVELAGEYTRAVTFDQTNPYEPDSSNSRTKIAVDVRNSDFVDMFYSRVFY